ncbi:S41 family peptidase [Clostridium sp. LIBA-8841]|uniref:S41 family peptidase n=1 Tax=Clostridium sp. LIBA-8841 TaxID=2987530 RepID=UPI002AC6AD04|nr:S41 family peptidase [Clostridium sp. LIBA-8841]MDZ5253645.1 S41 family peptidase [Clostridium sp. LIBA-8841]
MNSKKGEFDSLKKLVLITIPLVIIMSGIFFYYNRSYFDTEFNVGSNITIDDLDNNEIESLNKLCKVWGFAKYYHPKIVDGSKNWDFELFRVMPMILEAKNQDEVNNILYDWLNKLGKFKENSYSENTEVMVEADTNWISDEEYLSKNLSNLLVKMSKSYISDRDRAYVNFKDNPVYSNFDNERQYSFDYKDDGYKLLSLFRYWNIIEYYYPYRTVIGEDWNEVLNEFIPKIIDSDNDLSYKLTLSELTSKIHDSHASINDIAGTLYNYWGTNLAPIKFLLVENKIVVTNIINKYENACNLKVGDVILEINNKDIFEIIKEKSKYISFSRDEAIVNSLKYYLFRTSDDSLSLKIERDGKELIEEVKCYNAREVNLDEVNGESHELLSDNIGYINPGALAKDEIDSIMDKFKDTDRIIVDLRYYPSDIITHTMSDYLLSEETVFSKLTIANKSIPGEFIFPGDISVGKNNEDYYKGKIVVIINECTQSQAEFTAMALRKSPKAVVIGENSIGADGDVANITLPGGIITTITGIGVYTPEGLETQRIGIKPDIYVKPTIQGIRDGKDELLEKAIEISKLKN